MERSRRNLFIDMVVDMFIFENNQIMPFLCFSFVPKTGVGLPKSGVSFYVNCMKNFVLIINKLISRRGFHH